MMMQLRWLAVPVLAVIGLTGCAQSGSTAAIVNGVAIPDSKIVEYSNACGAVLRADPNELRFDMVQWAVLGEMSEQYLAEHPDQRPTGDELDKYVQQHQVLSYAVSDDDCRPVALGVAQHQVVALNLGGRASEYLPGNEVTLNPRYGVWNHDEQRPEPLASLSEISES